MKELVLASSNFKKAEEIAALFQGLPIVIKLLANFPDLPEAVENGSTFLENARLKAKHYSQYTNSACLADDSGLEVDALNSKPGVFSARFAGEQGNDADNKEKLLVELKATENRKARFCCVMVFIDVDGSQLETYGICKGEIIKESRGDGGFGYDSLFYVPEFGCTMAEMTLAEKNKISHRGKALRKMAVKLSRYMK